MNNQKAQLIIANNLSKEVELLKTDITIEERDISVNHIKHLSNILSNNKSMSEIEYLATEIEDSKSKTELLKASLFYNQVVDRFQYISEEELNKSYSLVLVKIELYYYEKDKKSELLNLIYSYICQFLGYVLINFKFDNNFFLKLIKNGFFSNYFHVSDFFPTETTDLMTLSGLRTIIRLKSEHHTIFENAYKSKRECTTEKKDLTVHIQHLEQKLESYFLKKTQKRIASF